MNVQQAARLAEAVYDAVLEKLGERVFRGEEAAGTGNDAAEAAKQATLMVFLAASDTPKAALVMDYVTKNPGCSPGNVRRATDCAYYMEDKPLDNAAHAALKALREAGLVKAVGGEWDEPRYHAVT